MNDLGGRFAQSLAPASQERASLLVVYATVFVYFLGFHALLPIITPFALSLGASVGLAGLIAGAYSAVNLVGNLGAGYWTDRLGRRLPLVLGLVTVGLALLLYPLARGPQALFWMRIVHGLGAALVAPASLSYVGDTAAPGRRARSMAVYGAAIGLTTLIGPPMAGLMQDRLGYAAVFITLAALTLIVAVPAFALTQETLPGAARSRGGQVRQVLARRRLFVAYAATFCLLFSLGVLIVFVPLAGQALAFSSARVGLFFASFALAAILIQVLPVGRLSDRWGREPLIMLGLGVLMVALLLLPGLSQWGTWMGAMFLYGIGFGLLFPAMTALIGDETEPSTRGTASGVFTAVFSLGASVGTGAAGAMVWLQQAAQIHPFQVAALVALLGAAWAGIAWTRRRAARRRRSA
jgi:MFS transporter, DHA1 family, multidrug resistance protein